MSLHIEGCVYSVLFILRVIILLVSMVEVISARVDEETRRRMKRLPHVNWSAVVRNAIQKKIRDEERRNEVDVTRIREAARSTDSLRRKHAGWDSAEEIRNWREKRQ